MIKKFAIAMLGAATAMSVWAQPAPRQVGAFANLTGLVTVSSGGSVSTPINGQRFVVGSNVAASGGSVTLKFDNGCEVTVNQSASYTVPENVECPAAYIPAGGSPVALGAAGGLLLPGVAGGITAIIRDRNNNRASRS